MKFDWTITKGGSWVAGPYCVTERVDNRGWNATALFEYTGEPEPDNTYVTIALECELAVDAMRAAEKWHRDVVTHLTREKML